MIVDSGPLSQRAAHAEQYAQTKTNTNPNTDPNQYRRRCPDPIARMQKFIHYMATAAICDSGLSPIYSAQVTQSVACSIVALQHYCQCQFDKIAQSLMSCA